MSKINVAKQLLDCTKVSDLTSLINDLGEAETIKWRPVGGNDNNLAIIGIGSDPAAGVIERATNAIDSILELEWLQHKEPTNITTPRMATEKWFGLKSGRLANYKTNDLKKLEKLAAKVEITLRSSDRDDKPTVDIRDYGVGILPEDFADSILSLNKNRKLRKLFLAGAFGQGGSSALAYSPWTMICSRRANLNSDKANPFAFTFVRFNPGDPNVDKHGVYEFMVDGKTGNPMVADISADDFPSGTLVRHLTMEIGKYNAVMTAPTASLWYLVHNYLFDPVYPFRISDKRAGKNVTGRMVTGNHRLLTRGENTEYQRDASLTFRDGSVTLKWWVLSAEGESARSRITQYVMASQPIVVTYNGQKQGYFPNTIVKDDLKLPYLDRYLIVHVDCDKLDADSRRQLFPTTREALRDTPIGDDLRRLVIDTLAGDEDLRRLDHERKRRYVKHEDQGAVDAIRRRLAKRIKTMSTNAGEGAGPKTNLPPGEPSVPKPRQAIAMQDPPTFLNISSSAPRKIYAGRSFTLKFETDARPDYFENADNFIAVINPPSIGGYTGTASVRDGYGVAYFRAQDDAPIGAVGKITLELRPPKHTSLSDTAEIIVSEVPQTAGGKQGEAATPNINPHWISDGDQYWKEMQWTKRSVANVASEIEGVDIYVSADNEKLAGLIARAQRRSMQAVDNVKNFYLEHICFYALLENTERQAKADLPTSSENAAALSTDFTQMTEGSLRHACETVCGIIEGLFEVLADAPPEK